MAEIQIVWSDPDLLAVNKPSGMRVIPDGYDPTLPTLTNVLQAEWGRLFVVHRLDKDTSGILLLARNGQIHRDLDRQFANRQILKIYLALVAGSPEWDEISIDLPLRVDADRQHRTIGDPQRGKPAQTEVRVLRRFPSFTLVEARPHTGYTHQIRAHLSAVGLPLLGDPLYRYPSSWKGARVTAADLPTFARTALHALQITFRHPTAQDELTLKTTLPPDFNDLISSFRETNTRA
jgi:tRNA pseudouridine32 synthase / 23S rRNA pseudouridine746 synthase